MDVLANERPPLCPSTILGQELKKKVQALSFFPSHRNIEPQKTPTPSIDQRQYGWTSRNKNRNMLFHKKSSTLMITSLVSCLSFDTNKKNSFEVDQSNTGSVEARTTSSISPAVGLGKSSLTKQTNTKLSSCVIARYGLVISIIKSLLSSRLMNFIMKPTQKLQLNKDTRLGQKAIQQSVQSDSHQKPHLQLTV